MLTEAIIKAAQPRDKRYKLNDLPMLHLEILPTGVKVFRRRYRIWSGGKSKDRTISLGNWPSISLRQAREKSTKIQAQLDEGIDPAGPAPDKDAPAFPDERRFENVAERFIEKRAKEGIADATLAKLRWNLGVASEHFEGRDVTTIKPPEVLRLIEIIQESGKLEKAKDIHRKLGQVFDFCVGLGWVEWNPAHMVKRAVVKTQGGRHPGLVEPKDVGGLMRAIRSYNGQLETRVALLMSAYTALRSGELRPARWAEISWDDKLWAVPQERMKGKYGVHLVPLSDQAMDALTFLREVVRQSGPDDLLFPAKTNKGRYLSDATLNAALRRLGYDTRQDHCQHGFRTTFSTNMNEQGWNRDWIERQLCHVSKDEVRRAYNKAMYLEGRIEMMQAYADWLDEVEAATYQ